jgi:hypothetical protein
MMSVQYLNQENRNTARYESMMSVQYPTNHQAEHHAPIIPISHPAMLQPHPITPFLLLETTWARSLNELNSRAVLDE